MCSGNRADDEKRGRWKVKKIQSQFYAEGKEELGRRRVRMRTIALAFSISLELGSCELA